MYSQIILLYTHETTRNIMKKNTQNKIDEIAKKSKLLPRLLIINEFWERMRNIKGLKTILYDLLNDSMEKIEDKIRFSNPQLTNWFRDPYYLIHIDKNYETIEQRISYMEEAIENACLKRIENIQIAENEKFKRKIDPKILTLSENMNLFLEQIKKLQDNEQEKKIA